MRQRLISQSMALEVVQLMSTVTKLVDLFEKHAPQAMDELSDALKREPVNAPVA